MPVEDSPMQCSVAHGRRVHLWAGGAVLAVVGCSQPATLDLVEPTAGPLVVMLTDFGNRDQYVGAVKGVVYERCPGVRIDAITQQIQPFDVRQGAEVLRRSAPYYPTGVVFLAIVDPGVGGPRRAVVARTRAGHVFVGPDNGLLWPTLQHERIDTVWHITNPALLRAEGLSSTFHGRDLFGPIAAYAASGADLNRVGPTVDPASLVPLKEEPATRSGAELHGRVVEVDRYGNVLTNIPAALLGELGIRRGSTIRVHVGGTAWTAPVVNTYSDVPKGQRLALINSERRLELAINLGNLAAAARIQPGQPLRVVIDR